MGAERWRSEREWPLARTEWRECFLAGTGNSTDRELATSPRDGEASWSFDPSTRDAYIGRPAVTYRTAPFGTPTEITGPLALYLVAASSARDQDWIVIVSDEAPGGKARELTRGWLRASHRALDAGRSTPSRPFHPHDRADPVPAGEAAERAVEIWPTRHAFAAGHRPRLDIDHSDDQSHTPDAQGAVLLPSQNRIQEGDHRSRLLVPIVSA